jgi:hypothetical protein
LEDPARLDLFSKSRFTKHCKWARDDSVETQFPLLCRPSCGIIWRTYARYHYGVLKDLSSKKIKLGVLDPEDRLTPDNPSVSIIAGA